MGGGPPDFPQDFTCPAVLRIPLAVFRFHIRGFHSLWPAFPKPFYYPHRNFSSLLTFMWSITPWYCYHGLGSFPFARRYLGNRCFFLFLRLLRCFSSPGSLCMAMEIALFYHTATEVYSARFPHSEICGSKDICSSPQLIAAYHVFHRLLVPRHPPCALIRLT